MDNFSFSVFIEPRFVAWEVNILFLVWLGIVFMLKTVDFLVLVLKFEITKEDFYLFIRLNV